MSEENTNKDIIQKRERSPSFPYIGLLAAVDLLETLFKAAKLNEMRLENVADEWGMSVKSGSFMRYVSALSQFGLIEISGVGPQRRIKVGANGRRILEDQRDGVYEELLSNAALKPKIIQELYFGSAESSGWGADRPNDNIASSYLVFEKNFSEEAAKRFLNVYDATIQCIIAVDNDLENSGAQEEKEEVGEFEKKETVFQNVKPINQPNNEMASKETDVSHESVGLNSITFQSNGDGIITINAKLDLMGLDLLEKKIAAFKILLN